MFTCKPQMYIICVRTKYANILSLNNKYINTSIFTYYIKHYRINMYRLIKSSRGGFKLTEGGYIYDKQRVCGEITHWQCEKKSECKARLHTKEDHIVKRTNDHLHGPDNTKVSCFETKIGIKRRAQTTHETSHHIIGDSVLELSEGTSAKLPKLNSLKRTLQRQREKENAAPAQPTSLEELVIPLEYTKTGKGDNFLLYDSGPNLHPILILGTHRNIEMLAASQIWLADGTFKTAPLLFGQVYVIHGLR